MRKIRFLENDWRFGRLTEEDYVNVKKTTRLENVNIPHTWYQEGEKDNIGYGYYVTRLSKSELETGYHYIRFQAVSLIAAVYFNGQKIGYHEGGYSAFTVTLPTDTLEDENILEVFVSNVVSDNISPAAGDFTVFGGIHRRVEWLSFDTEHHFDVTYFGTEGVVIKSSLDDDLTTGHLTIQPYIKDTLLCDASFKAELYDADQQIVASWTFEKELDVVVSQPMLWNGRQNPYLYTVIVTYQNDFQVFDKVSQQIGFRHIQLSAQSGFYLNGQHLKLNGVARHNDSSEVYSAVTEAELTRDLNLIEEIGANALRLSHYQHPIAMYREADKRGYVVWAEIPLLKVAFTEAAKENAKQQTAELLLQNSHNPSICFWGIQNEVAIYTEDVLAAPFVEEIKDYAESLDKTRIFTVANLFNVKAESPLNQTTKMVGYNIYFGWYYGKMGDYGAFLDDYHEKLPEIALGISEYGVDANSNFHSSNPKVRDYTEEFQSLFHETVYPQIQARDYLWGSFIWNMFDFSSSHRDEGGIKYRNLKGLITYDRHVKKDAFYYYKSQWSSEPFVYLAEKRFSSRTGDVLSLKVYSNQKEVVFETDGQTHKVLSENGIFKIDMPFPQEVMDVTVTSGELTDSSTFTKVEELPREYIYQDANPGINVQNWFENEDEKAKLFPDDCYSVMDSVSVLLEKNETVAVLEKYMPDHLPSMRERGGNLPLHRVIYYLKGAYTDEDVQAINNALKQIKKD